MNIEQLYTGCLSQGAYFIESHGEAAVIDPIREVDHYILMAEEAGARIKYIFETHFHADFVSGHLELAAKTGATIIYGPGAVTKFPAHIGKDNEKFEIGELCIRLLHTPGHTLESSCYLLEDHDGKPAAVFTGDTLFIGDVGRPDLAQQPVAGITVEHLAGMLYDSLRTKLLALPDDLIIYPAHGAGSACGKNMSSERFDTLGNQKTTNYALDMALTREQFIQVVTDGLKPAPAYFPMNVKLNSQGYQTLMDVVQKGVQPLQPANIRQIIKGNNKIIILDTRLPGDFAEGHIPGAINIGLNGSFAPWVGALLPFEGTSIVVVAERGFVTETITRLARIGYENVVGYLVGSMASWIKASYETQRIANISAQDFVRINNGGLKVIDVRNDVEYKGGSVIGATHYPLGDFDAFKHLPVKDDTYYVYCAGGYRSMIYISMLKATKNINLINIEGGYDALKKEINAVEL